MKKKYVRPEFVKLLCETQLPLQDSSDWNVSGETPPVSGDDNPPPGPITAPRLWDSYEE